MRINRFLFLVTMLGINSFCFAKQPLSDYRFNKYSQFGEDGIIQKIFYVIGTTSKICIEFGAWDGFYLSNTANLWANDFSWKGYLIECDKNRFESLLKNVDRRANCFPICALIGIEPENLLEIILSKEGFDFDQPVDLLSIDVDGNDYHIFKSLDRIKPRVVICEFNPTIPFYFDIYAEYSPKNFFGCSSGALVRLAAEKDYSLVAMTDVNCFFVRNELIHLFEDFETDLRLIFSQSHYLSLITAYDGSYKLVKKGTKDTPFGINKQQIREKLFGDFSALSL